MPSKKKPQQSIRLDTWLQLRLQLTAGLPDTMGVNHLDQDALRLGVIKASVRGN